MNNSGFSLIGQPDRPYRVLVVDDDEMHLSMHVETLQSLPCQVTTTTSGYDALSLVRYLSICSRMIRVDSMLIEAVQS
jgi:CheY-like chemotaxis protein